MTAIHVQVRAFSREESDALLAKHHVGRVTFAFHDRMALALVNYVYSKEWIYVRMEPGPQLATLKHHQWVAFGVDEINGIYDWRSVTIHGSVQLLSPDKAVAGLRDYNTALELMRSVVPAILTKDDPMPQRVQLMRIHVDEIEGRESRSSGADALPRP